MFARQLDIPLIFKDSGGVERRVLLGYDAADPACEPGAVAARLAAVHGLSPPQTAAIRLHIVSVIHAQACAMLEASGVPLYPADANLGGAAAAAPASELAERVRLAEVLLARATRQPALLGGGSITLLAGDARQLAGAQLFTPQMLVGTMVPQKRRAAGAASRAGGGGGEGDGTTAPPAKRAKMTKEDGKRSGAGSAAAASGGKARSSDSDDSDGGDGDEDVVEDDGNFDSCDVCLKGGQLMCCERCPRSFHPKCAGYKTVEEAPDDWYCATCTAAFGPDKEHEDSETGPMVTRFFSGPWEAHGGVSPAMPYTGKRAVGTPEEEVLRLVDHLLAHDWGDIFSKPVVGVPHYHDFIKNPRDLGTIKAALDARRYVVKSPEGGMRFDAPRAMGDIRLVFHNARVFNKRSSTIWRIAEELFRVSETWFRDRVRLNAAEATRLAGYRAAECPPLAS